MSKAYHMDQVYENMHLVLLIEEALHLATSAAVCITCIMAYYLRHM